MAEFKEGDIVYLKSGSPRMTLEQYPYVDPAGSHDDRAKCTWFLNSELKREVFRISALELYKEDESL